MAKVRVKLSKAQIKQISSKVIKQANKVLPSKIEKIIKERIAKGVSPVQGYGRFQKYSPSYIEQIKNKAAYRTAKNGKVYRVSPDNVTGRAQKAGIRDKVTDLNDSVLRHGKRVRPVNLKLSGDMLSKFFVKPIKRGYKIGIRHKLADIHNNKGAGKSKVIRRMIPRPGENFTKSIIRDIIKELKKIIKAKA